jgi:hypothetical protein
MTLPATPQQRMAVTSSGANGGVDRDSASAADSDADSSCSRRSVLPPISSASSGCCRSASSERQAHYFSDAS